MFARQSVLVAFLIIAIAGMILRATGQNAPVQIDLVPHILGGTLALIAVLLSEQQLARLHLPLLVSINILLIAVLFSPLGHVSHGASRWLCLGRWHFQPSELSKPLLVLSMAVITCRPKQPGFRRCVLAALISIILVATEPDFGTAIILLAVVLVATWNFQKRLAIAVSVIVLSIVVPLAMTWPHVASRLELFRKPMEDPQGRGYQIVQSRELLSHTTWRGIAAEQRSRIVSLPSAYRDFALVSLTARFGYLVGILILALPGVALTLASMSTCRKTPLDQHLFLIGMAALFVQTLVNTMSELGLIPLTGVPFPFLSAGGSSIVATWLILALSNRYTLAEATHDLDK